MKLRTLLLVGIVGICFSCTKDETPAPPPLPENHYGETFQIQLTIDGVPRSKVYPADKINKKVTYIEDSATGSYFGGGPSYELDGGGILFIQLATGFGNLKTNWDGAFASFVSTCSPGSKVYDSINYMTQTHPNRCEITFWDGISLYCSTKVAGPLTGPKPVKLPIDQSGSSFVITSQKLVSTTNGKNNAILIKGTFNCTLYKIDTFEPKKITNGSFVAVFDVI